MDLRSPLGLLDIPSEAPSAGPQLLVELEPRAAVFFRNLRDIVLFRNAPDLREFPQGEFWNDVFVLPRRPWASLVASGFAHGGLVAGVYFILQLPIFQMHPRTIVDPFEHRTITYYNVSEYLPPINLLSAPARQKVAGQPALFKQEILSVPPEPDNSRQTIVTPPKVILASEVPMPNIVVWEKVPIAQPTAASQRAISQLSVPKLNVEIVDPVADTSSTQPKLLLPWLRPQVIEPPAEVSSLSAQRLKPAQVAVVEPTADLADISRPPGQLNVSHPAVDVATPKLPVQAQRVASAGAATGGTGSERVDAPPPPVPQGLGASPNGAGRLIALSVAPSNVTEAIPVPAGNRSGVFASGPSGKEGAPSTPDLQGGGTGTGGNGPADTKATSVGISVGAAPKPPSPMPGSLNEAQKRVLMASLARPPLPGPAAKPSLDAPSKVENQVFGAKRIYSMVLNMPNLTSRSGSWIIKFAELKESEAGGDLSGPVATLKVDPAYPADLIRDRVEGTVVLYAVIHSDGHVDDVKILTGIDDRLDQNAIRALSRWHFQPATKNGQAVALEAVVQIPFRATTPF